MSGPDRGVQFPLLEGRRSTTATSRDVLSVAAAAADPDLAADIAEAGDWRRAYPRHLRALTAAAARRGDDASAIARAGLDRLHAVFEVVDEDGRARPIDEAVAATPATPLGTRVVEGEGPPVEELVVPYRGRELRGDGLIAQTEEWADRGVVEPSFVEAIARVVGHPEWLDLRGRSFGLLGAGAEMGPTEHLLSWGADVAAVDVPTVPVYGRLEALTRARSGRLLVPARPEGGDGADLTTEADRIRAWLEGLDGPVVVGNYAYADGADFVRVAMAADAVIVTLLRAREDVSLAYLATPTDVFAVPPEAVAMSRERQRPSGAKGTAIRAARAATGGRAFVPNYRMTVQDEQGRELGIADSLIVQQGPNYALAKRLQRWRALVARQDGVSSSVHVAPPTRTRSVTKNRVLAAAYAGAHVVDVEPFEPATSRALMSALLVHDLHHEAGAVDRGTEVEHDLTVAAAHGGLWRVAWEPRTALPVAVAVGAMALLGGR